MLKPVITLKNLKTMPSLSEETTCFTATVYVDGVKFVEASNTGQGGEDRYHPVKGVTYQDIADLEQRIAATYPKFDLSEGLGQIDMDLSLLIGEEITNGVWIKDYRRATKTKVLYIKPGEKAVYQMKFQPAHSLAKHVEFIRKGTPGAVVLNELPEAEGLALYKANVTQR